MFNDFALKTIACIIVLSFPARALGEGLKLKASTSAIAGRTAFSAGWLNGKREKLELDFAARYKYFVMNNFALDVDLGSLTTFIPETRESIALGFGLSYFFDTKTIIYPYLGLLGGLGYLLVATTNVPFASVKPEFGALFALSEHWAIDIGARMDFGFGIFLPKDVKLNRISLSTGYFGLIWFI